MVQQAKIVLLKCILLRVGTKLSGLPSCLGRQLPRPIFLTRHPRKTVMRKFLFFCDYNVVVDEHDDEDLVDFGQRR